MVNRPYKVAVVEDNDWYNKLLVHNLKLNPDLEISSFKDGKGILNFLNQLPDIITLDYRLPDFDGEELFKRIKSACPQAAVIIISEQDEIETAVNLLQLGASDYLVKSKDIKERLHHSINRIIENKGLKEEINELKKEVQQKYSFEKSIVGKSKAMLSLYELMNKTLDTNITVSIHGETGTGKEVIAKALHYNSNRKNAPFIAINVAAVPQELIESELFGHEKGAFTNADSRRIGKFEQANGGTLFLDEIGEMDLNFQSKLLRVLQEREVVRVGGSETIKIDCRIFIATHKNLELEVQNGQFREDLFYRLSGIKIEIPALRERGKDILLLAQSFIKSFCKENEVSIKTISESAQQKLLSYSFPGNVRELKSIIEVAIVMSPDEEIHAEHINLRDSELIPVITEQEDTMRGYQKKIIELFMKKNNNDTKKVADKLAIGQTTVYRILNES